MRKTLLCLFLILFSLAVTANAQRPRKCPAPNGTEKVEIKYTPQGDIDFYPCPARNLLLRGNPFGGGGGGEVNTASNLGAGAGIFRQKSGVDLQFKSLVPGSGIAIASNTNDLTVSVVRSPDANNALELRANGLYVPTGGGGGGSGTVTSVGLSMPSIFTISGSPVTTSGTLTATLASQTNNQFLGAPDGANGTPTFRALTSNDIPSLNASKINAGVFSTARLGTGTANSTTFLRGDGTWATPAGGGGSTIPVSDEGTQITAGVTSFNFTGAGVSSTNSGNAVTVNIPGGGSGTATAIQTGAALPGTCAVGEVFMLTGSPESFKCNPANTWNQDAMASAAGSTANQILGRNAANNAFETKTFNNSTSVTVTHSANALEVRRAALTGDVTAAANSNATTIANNAVTTAKIGDNQVTFGKIQTGTANRLVGFNQSGVFGEFTVSNAFTVNFASLSLNAPDCDNATTSKLLWDAGTSTFTCGTDQTGGGGGGNPGGSGTELQFRGGASTFSALTGSSVSGSDLTLGGNLSLNASSAARSLSTNGNQLNLSQTGDAQGSATLRLMNRSTANHGVVVETGGSEDVVQVSFKPPVSAQSNITFEGRNANKISALNGEGEFQFQIGGVNALALGDDRNYSLLKHYFSPNTVRAGVNLGAVGGNPTTLENGDIWYDSTAGKVKARENGVTVNLSDGGGGGSQEFFESLLKGNLNPETSGNVFLEPASVKRTNDFFLENVWIFNNPNASPVADRKLYGSFETPAACSSASTFQLVFTSTATSGTSQWSLAYRVVTANDTNSLDQSSAVRTLTGSSAAPTSANLRKTLNFTATDADFSAAGTVQWVLARPFTGDTLAAAAQVAGLTFKCTR